MATIVKTEKRPLSLFGRLFRGLFLAFNLMMLFWMVSAMGAFSQLRSESDAESLEQSIGAVAGFGVLIGLWIVIDLVLGILVLATRAPKVLVEETVKPRWDADSGETPSALGLDADAMIARYKQQQEELQQAERRQAERPQASLPAQRQASFGRRR